MARTALTVATLAVTSVTNATTGDTAAIADGHKFSNPKGTALFYANNANGSPVTISFQTPQTVGGGIAVADVSIVLAANTIGLFGPFAKPTFSQSDGMVYSDYSATTSLTVMAFDV